MDATGRLFRRWEMVDLALRTFVLVVGPPAAVLLVGDGRSWRGKEESRDFSARHCRENTTEVEITGRPAVSFQRGSRVGP